MDNILAVDPGQDRMVFEVYAWVCIDPKTNLESLCAIMSTDGGPFQAVSSSLDTIMTMKPYFLELSKASGKNFKLVKFGSTQVLEEI